MSSRISLRDLLRQEMKQTAWLPVLIGAAAVFLYPVRYLLAMQNLDSYISLYGLSDGLDRTRELRRETLSILGAGDVLTLFALVTAGILAAVTAFSYLDRRERVDMYHSLAIRRGPLFTVQFLCGWLSAVIPYLIFVLAAFFGIGMLFGVVDAGTAGSILAGAGMHVVAFTAVYAVAALAMQLTGRILTGVLMSIFLLGYGPACYYLIWSMTETVFSTWWNVGAGPAWWIPVRVLSPVMDLPGLASGGKELRTAVIVLAVWAAAAFLAGRQTARVRPSEAAENAMAHPLLERIVKVAVVVPGALLAGMLLYDIADRAHAGWFLAGTVLAAVLLGGIMEFIYTPDLRNILRHWRSGLAGLCLSTALAVFFLTDPVGYDRWLPEKSEVEAMAMADLEQSWTFGSIYPEQEEVLRDMLREAAVTEFDPVYAAAEAGVEDVTRGRDPSGDAAGPYDGADGETDPEEELAIPRDAVIYYRLKNGKEVFRKYRIPTGVLQKAERALAGDPRQEGLLYPVTCLKTEDIRGFEISVWKEEADGTYEYDDTLLDLSPSETEKLIGILREDTLRAGMDVIGEGPAAELIPLWTTEETFGGSGPYRIESFYILPSYTETIAYLKEKGVEFPERKTAAGSADISGDGQDRTAS